MSLGKLSLTMSSLLVFFFSKIDQDIYYVEQNFRGT